MQTLALRMRKTSSLLCIRGRCCGPLPAPSCFRGWVRDEGGNRRFVSLDELREMMGKEEWLDSSLNFFEGLRADEKDRYRWDRLVALHIILLAFIKDFGHEF